MLDQQGGKAAHATCLLSLCTRKGQLYTYIMIIIQIVYTYSHIDYMMLWNHIIMGRHIVLVLSVCLLETLTLLTFEW